jgi:phenylpyruvate tautomerase PptA (4-oxalocrotonate tautomerase family)
LPLAKLHVPAELGPDECQALAQDARQAIIRALEVQPIRVKVLVYTSPAWCRAVHAERDPGFVLAEVLFFQGRSRELKDRLLSELNRVILDHLDLTIENVFINIQESSRDSWGLMGGVPGDKLNLGY